MLLWASLIITVLYTWSLFTAIGVLSMDQVQKFLESIYVTAASNIYGVWFANILNIAAWTAAATCLLMGTIYQPPRDLYNLSRNGYKVPRWFGSLHPRYPNPGVDHPARVGARRGARDRRAAVGADEGVPAARLRGGVGVVHLMALDAAGGIRLPPQVRRRRRRTSLARAAMG